MSKFEIKGFDTHNWQRISEVDALNMLQKIFEHITPKITEMLDGKEIKIPDGILRINRHNPFFRNFVDCIFDYTAGVIQKFF